MRDAFDMALLSFHIPLFRLILPQRLEPLAYHRIRIVGFQSNSGFGAWLIYFLRAYYVPLAWITSGFSLSPPF